MPKYTATKRQVSSPASREKTANPASLQRKNGFPWALSADCVLLLFFLFTGEVSLKPEMHVYFALGAALIFLFAFLTSSDRLLLIRNPSIFCIILMAQCLWSFAGLFYSAYPKFALQQFLLGAGAFFVFATAYLQFLRSERNIAKTAGLFSACLAIASLFSIELATSGHLRALPESLAALFGAALPNGYAAFETNTRILTVLGRPNIFAPLAVLSMFASIWLARAAGNNTRKTLVYMSLATVSGVAFVLCFSLGTILAYAVALAVLLWAAPKETRRSQSFAYGICLLFSLLTAGVVFALRERGILPLLAVVALSIACALLYVYLKKLRLPALFALPKKALLIGTLLLCAALLAGVFTLRGAYIMEPGDTFRRAVSLDPGTYTLELALDGTEDAGVFVSVQSMNYTQAALKERTPLAGAALRFGGTLSFTVPDGSAAVFFTFSADSDITVRQASISGTNIEKALPLRYLLAPEFIVNRLQGIWVNDNAIQRFIFFRDGIRLALESPVVGLGGGAFEGRLLSVADYHYETKHSHNEYIQRFLEGGIVGFLLFAFLPAAAFAGLRRLKKSDGSGERFAFLAGCMALVFLHIFIEMDFIMPSFQIAFSFLFAAAAVWCGDFWTPKPKWKPVSAAALALLFAAGLLLPLGRYTALSSLQKAPTPRALQKAIRLDPFNRTDYMLSYLLGTGETDSPVVLATQKKYLTALSGGKNGRDILAQYCLLKPRPELETGIAAAETYVYANRVDAQAWDKIFSLYHTALEKAPRGSATRDELFASINALCAYLLELNTTLPKQIAPALATYSYLLANAPESGSVLVDSKIPCDLNGDGTSDFLAGFDGETAQLKIMLFLFPKPYTVKVYQPETAACEILLGGIAWEAAYNAAAGCYEATVFVNTPSSVELLIRTAFNPNDVSFSIEETA